MVVQAVSDLQSTSAHLRFSTGIVKRLGEELNPTLSKSILELAKNAYDADATECKIELQDVSRPGGTIIVRDNGDGMTPSQIADGWLVLGQSSKNPSSRTRLGRIPAGSKGLGRLAALRMGRDTLLSTTSKQEKTLRHELTIKWDEFDNAQIAEDFALKITTRSGGHQGFTSGTEVRINDLRSACSQMEVKRLARELILLADPFDDNPRGFHPELCTSEFEDLELLVQNRYFNDAEFHLSAEICANGEAIAKIVDWRGELLYEAKHSDIVPKSKGRTRYRCPPAKFDLWVFILNKDTFSSRRSAIGEVRRWLKDFGGVHIYYNNLRVNPYGGPDDDWLGMNLRRVRSPEERPGTNTSIGRVVVHDEKNQLSEKTDRSGFIENNAFRDLRSFARDTMDWMAKCRVKEAEHRRHRARTTAAKQSDIAQLEFMSKIADVPREMQDVIKDAFSLYESSRNREVNVLQKEVQLYRTLSTAGITAATFAHESIANPIKIVRHSVAAIERRAKKFSGELFSSHFKNPINSAKRALSSFTVLANVTLSLLDHEKRRNTRLELHNILDDVLDTFSPFFRGADVKVIKKLVQGSPFLRGQRAAVESIMTNLLNNSIAAFEDAGTQGRIIEISTQIVDNNWCLSISDSGPGIIGISKSDIWLPGQTTRKHGTGLGLTIVRDAVLDLGGSIEAVERGPHGGAVITVYLPIIGA